MFMTIRYTELLCCLPCDVVFNLSKLLAAIFTLIQGVLWTPSKMIARLGKEIDNPESVYYWAYKVSPPATNCECDVEK